MGDGRQNIVEMVEKMPAFPRSVHRVLELTSDINADPRELVAVIEHDPVLILKILKMVNSPYFGLAQKVTSVNQAVVYIGFNTVKHLALSAAAIGSLPRKSLAGFDMDAFLLHSLATATIARLFARKLHVQTKDFFDFFLSGLLHDFGKIVFAHFMPLEFSHALRLAKERNVPLYGAEKEIFKIDHTEVGSLLGEKWNLPENILASLTGHHNHNGANQLIVDVVSAANEISKELKIGIGGSIVEKMPEEINNLFGTDIDGIVTALGDVEAEVEKVKIFINL